MDFGLPSFLNIRFSTTNSMMALVVSVPPPFSWYSTVYRLPDVSSIR